MFDDPFADLEGQIQPRKTGVALLEAFDDAQGVQVVVEPVAEALHFAVQRLLAGMGERRMADIVGQRQRFGQILVQLQDVGQRARDLRDFDGVGQAVAEVVGEAGRENLRLGFQPAEGTGMNHAVAVALEGVAVRMRGFGISPPPASLHRKSQPRQHAGDAATGTAVSASMVSATCPTLPGRVRNGSSSLRASAGFFGASSRASEMVAWSAETKIVGWAIRSRSIFSPWSARPSAK